MKNIQKSLCNVAVVLGLAAMSSQAFAAEEPSLFNDGSAPAMTAPVPAPSVAPVSSVPAPVASTAPVASKVSDSKKETLDESSETQDNVLRQVSVLQSKYMLKKVQKDIEDLDGKKNDAQANNQNIQNGSPMLGQGQSYNGVMPSGLPPMPSSQPVAPVATAPIVVKEPEPVMNTTAIYSLGNQAYAEINVNGNKFVAKRGTKLPNGYTVSALNDLGVTLTKGKRKISLPVVASSAVNDTSISTSTASSVLSGAPSIMPIPQSR